MPKVMPKFMPKLMLPRLSLRLPRLTPLAASAGAQLRHIGYRLLPCRCLLCASTSGDQLLCMGCQMDLPYSAHRQLCQQCGLQLESLSFVCGHCLAHPPAFRRCIIPFAYEYPLDSLIHRFKYHRQLTSGKLLSQLFADYLKYHAQADADWHTPDLLIPAPMHWLRRWQRGFNQAEFIARHIAAELAIPLACNIIKRTHNTPAQKELTRALRQLNLRKAFVISEKDAACLYGKHIALIDDVVTTTATVRELSQLLINAGAKEVQVWALARTM